MGSSPSDKPELPSPSRSPAPLSSPQPQTASPSPKASPAVVIQSPFAPPARTIQLSYESLANWVRNMAGSGQKQRGSLASMKETSAHQWNTKHLSMRIAGDATAAAAAGGLVAPLISIIDRGIIENASNRATLSNSIRSSINTLFLRPHNFLSSKQFLLVFALYGGTYLSANSLDTLTSTIRSRPASSITSGTSKFIATSATNLSLCLYKDSQFTKMFGAVTSGVRGVPTVSYALFAIRDCMTVFASFNLPPILAPMLPVTSGVEKFASSASIAQFLAPAGVQIFSTPLHLLGLDLYNRPRGEGVSIVSRSQRVLRDWGKSCAARVCRIVPAFGVGGVVNTRVRAWWMEGLE